MDLKAGHHFIFIPKRRLKKLSESQGISLSTVRVISVDKQKIEEFLKDYKKFLRKKNVSKAFLFGSWAKGNYSPYSDLDILIIIDSSPKKVRDRCPDFLPRHAPVGIDVFVFTIEEAERSPFVQNIMKEAIPLIE